MEIVPDGMAGLDPNLFAVNWPVLLEALSVLVVLAMLVERALAQLFDSHWFLAIEIERADRGLGTFKPLIAFVASAAICVLWNFDVVTILLGKQVDTLLGGILTGAVVAGGSKGAMKLFENVLGWRSGKAEQISAYRAGRGERPNFSTGKAAPAASRGEGAVAEGEAA
jgi:hypothetical protein